MAGISVGIFSCERLATSAAIIICLVLSGHASFPIGAEAQQAPVPAPAPKAHFVLVHGFFEGAWQWYEVSTLLQQKGFTVTAVDLTAMGINPTNANDVSSLEQFAAPLTEILKNVTGQVILVGHSFGGVSISLELEYFPAKIAKGVYLSAFMPKNGESAAKFLTPAVIAQEVAAGIFTYVYGNASNPSQITSYGNGPNKTGLIETYFTLAPPKDVTLKLLLGKPQPYEPSIQNLTLTEANYGSVPRYYIRTELDQALKPAVQSAIIANNPPTQVFSLANADHGSFFSQPVELTNLLEYIAAL